MSLAEFDSSTLEKLFSKVGFEEQPNDIPSITNIQPSNTINETVQKEDLDPDIAALLGDSPDTLEEDSDSQDDNPNDDDEVYTFLDEPTDSKTSRISSRVKQHEAKNEIVPIENNILPKNLLFNLNITENRLDELFRNLGEKIIESANDSSSFLDEQKQNSRLMSRIKQHEVKELKPIENHTLPKTLIFNLNLPKNRLKELFSGLGEEITQSKDDSSFLDEQKQGSRLMSRIKQHEVKELKPIENYTLPKTLLFNLNLPDKQIKNLLIKIGD